MYVINGSIFIHNINNISIFYWPFIIKINKYINENTQYYIRYVVVVLLWELWISLWSKEELEQAKRKTWIELKSFLEEKKMIVCWHIVLRFSLTDSLHQTLNGASFIFIFNLFKA